jgi:predicted transcriptional regulator
LSEEIRNSGPVLQRTTLSPDFDPASWVTDSNRKAFRRSHTEVMMDMLKVIKEGAEKPTQIMYKANISWVALQTHLTRLLDRGLCVWAAAGERRRYELTAKGANMVYSYGKILEMAGDEPGRPL